MKAKVWFMPVTDGEASGSVARKAAKLADLAGLADIVRKNSLIGILQHVGEGDGIGYIKPQVTRALASRILQLEAKPFLTGTSTLYRGQRSNARDHIMQAYDHGFTPTGIGCPIIMCDGLRGADHIAVKVQGATRERTAYLGSAVALMDGLVAVSHPTGHPAAGFAGAIKNVSMGLSSRGGKMSMHYGGHPDFVAEDCTACGRCAQWCPEDAIVIKQTAELTPEKCIGCGQCFSVCAFDAIDFKWNESGLEFQKGLVEYCLAVKEQVKSRILCINIIQYFQKGCDCFDNRQKKFCPDVGIVASRDIVAVDTATADLLIRTTGQDIVREVGKRDYRKMLAYAEKLGLGSQDYELIEV